MSRSDPDQEWKVALFEDAVRSGRVRHLAWQLAEELREEGDPELNLADQQCARRYLERCVLNASVNELSGMSEADLAAWWARGTIGACRYRSRARAGASVQRPQRHRDPSRQDGSAPARSRRGGSDEA